MAMKTSVKVGSASPRVWTLNCKNRVERIQRHACVHLPLPPAVVLPPDCSAVIDGSLELCARQALSP